MIKRQMIFTVVFLVVLSASMVWGETIKMGGSGGMIKLANELAKAYMEKNPGDVIEVSQQSLEAKGGIMGAYDGMLDIGMTARNLEESEKGLGLKVMEIARVGTVIGVNASVTVDNITKTQLCNVYEGKIKNWKGLGGADVNIMVFTRPDPDSTKVSVREGIACFASLKESSDIAIMPKYKDMNNALANNPNSIGFSDLEAIEQSNGKIKMLKLDGAGPTADSVASGKWPMIKHFNIVQGKKQSDTAKKFIEFIRTPAGQEIIRKNSAVPLKF